MVFLEWEFPHSIGTIHLGGVFRMNGGWDYIALSEDRVPHDTPWYSTVNHHNSLKNDHCFNGEHPIFRQTQVSCVSYVLYSIVHSFVCYLIVNSYV